MTPAGFEPAPPKRTDLKSVALDHSAIRSSNRTGIYILFILNHLNQEIYRCEIP